MTAAEESLRARIERSLQDVRARIVNAAARVGRSPDEILLVAISKTRSPHEIAAAHACGLVHLGENRIEELEDKLPALRGMIDEPPVTWHMVGHVQSRKARRVVDACDVVHSVDSVRLASRLDRFARQAGRRLPVLLEVNVSGEESKYGFEAWDPGRRQALVDDLAPLAELDNLDVRGLMTMAPLGAPDHELHRVFGALRELRDELRHQLPFTGWDDLSMGMTDDFEVAIEEGATIVRIGRAIFGPRNE